MATSLTFGYKTCPQCTGNIAEPRHFAMRDQDLRSHSFPRLRGICLALAALMLFFNLPAHAQTTDTMVYTVTDIAVDVTADSAAHARDQAVGEAQRAGFNQLLERLGVDPALGAK